MQYIALVQHSTAQYSPAGSDMGVDTNWRSDEGQVVRGRSGDSQENTRWTSFIYTIQNSSGESLALVESKLVTVYHRSTMPTLSIYKTFLAFLSYDRYFWLRPRGWTGVWMNISISTFDFDSMTPIACAAVFNQKCWLSSWPIWDLFRI